jgi:rhodanese-related sulfurtransferase
MILEERITTMLNGGFKGIDGMNVVDSPNGYFINNFWDMTDVDHYGHISTAFRIKPLGLSNVQTLNPSKPLVTYCWTGQTSSMVTAYMTVLGYNAKSLTFGTNGLIYSELESHKFVTPTVDRPTVQ